MTPRTPDPDQNRYELGNTVRLSVQFTDNTTSSSVDPSVVKLDVKDPDGTVTTYTYGDGDDMQRSGTGAYYVDVDVDTEGQWYYRWYSTGTGKAAAELPLFVEPIETD